MRRPLLAWASRISTRLLAFNLLLVFLPIAAFFALDTYEKQLLRALEHALVQQARLLASALSGHGRLDPLEAERILRQLAGRQEARLRVVDSSGRLVADSSRLGAPAEPSDDEDSQRTASERALYRLASFPVRVYRRLVRPPQRPLESSEFYGGASVLAGSEVRDALAGRYGAATRISSGGQRSVTLYSAIPIWAGDPGTRQPSAEQVVGAVLASQSTYRILRDLYELRLQVLRIFLGSLAAAVAISLFVSATITRPLRTLQAQARLVLDHRGRIAGHIEAHHRRDEIGDLSRSLAELTRKQEEHLRVVESFAADLAHELKNPLAAIRSAAEMAQSAGGAEAERFLEMIRRDVSRAERLVSGVREISRVDARLAEEPRERVDVVRLARDTIEVLRLRDEADSIEYRLHAEETPVLVEVCPDRIVQALEKILENAASFSVRGGEVEVSIRRCGAEAVVEIADRGPGIPPEILGRIFERFFSYRPSSCTAEGESRGACSDGDEEHTGLGLALARTIVEGYGGRIEARDREGGGAVFEVRLPALPRQAASSPGPRRRA